MPHNLWSELRSTAARWMLKRVQHDEEGGEVAKQPPQQQMGPTLLSAPSTPALQPHDFGRSPVPGLSSLALPSPCGSGCGLLGLSGGSSEPAFITRPPCRCPVPSGGRFRPCGLLLPPGGSVTALDALSFRRLVPLRRSSASPAFFPTAVKSDLLTLRLSLHLRFARFRPKSS